MSSKESQINSLDKTDQKLDEIWAKEAEERLDGYRQNLLESTPMMDVFPEKQCAFLCY